MIPAMLHRARIPALLLAAALAAAGDAPTDAEWAPVAQAIEAGGSEAVTAISDLTARYPQWIDGQRALAVACLRAGDPAAAYRAVIAAMRLNRRDVPAAILGIQSRAMVSRFEDAYKIADLFTDEQDPGGTVAAQAAITALQAGDEKRMGTYVELARKRAGGQGVPLLEFIEAKRQQRLGDLAAAAAALDRAIALRADYRDALYELGRVRIVQALSEADKAIDLFRQAADVLDKAARLDRADADSRFALGRARLERGKRLTAAKRADEGGAELRMAISALDEGLQLKPDNRDAKLWKGDALLRLERYAEAAPLLKQALNQGALDRSLPFNLSLAYSRSGQPGEARDALARVQAETADERLTLAMSAFGMGNYPAAQEILLKILENRLLPADTPEQQTRYAAALRYYAHCSRLMAEQEPEDSPRREELINDAVDKYLRAGSERDLLARQWYLHLQVPRSPLHAFMAGRQLVTWDGWWNPPAWKLLAANYGYKVSRGEGIGGAIKYGPAHVMLWLLLSFIPVGLFLKSWLLPHGLYGGAGKGKPAPGKGGPAKPAAKPGPRKPATATAKKPGSATVKKESPGALEPKATEGTGPKTPFS